MGNPLSLSWWNSLGFQDGGSPLIEQLVLFHDHSIVVLTLVVTLVGYIMARALRNKFINLVLLEGQVIEVI